MSQTAKTIQARLADALVEPVGLPVSELPGEPASSGAGERSTWDIVDESSWESFPASDPPAWF